VGSYVLLTVTDSGEGMSDQTKSHLFEPFFTTKEQGKGTGLGLSTVYGIVKQSDGQIRVESEPGRGTKFEIFLPRVDAPQAPEATVREAESGPTTGTETILLVEDDEAVRELSREILEMNGYEVLEATNGQDALNICENRDREFHLIVTDLVMPEMGGRDLADAVGPTMPETKILFLSGYADSVVFHQGMLEEGSFFLQKPFTPTGLAQKVRQVLDGR
jgi:CheY-like chemotaxis protein